MPMLPGREWRRVAAAAALYLATLLGLYRFDPLVDGRILIHLLDLANWATIVVLTATVNTALGGDRLFPSTPARWTRLLAAIYAFNLAIVAVGGVGVRLLWYYPRVETWLYWLLAPGAYLIYGLILYGLYRVVRLHGTDRDGRPEPLPDRYVRLAAAVGVLGVLAASLYLVRTVLTHGITVGVVSTYTPLDVPLWYVLGTPFAVLLLLDAAAHARGKDTLLAHVSSGEFAPLKAATLAALIGIVLLELPHLPLRYWVYVNWPLDMTLLGLPVTMYAAYLFHVLVFVATVNVLLPVDDSAW